MKLPIMYDSASQRERKQAREEYIKKQSGRCYHCELPLLVEPPKRNPIDETQFPNGFFDHPIHLHHDHKTGLTLGAVHAYCNAELAIYYGE